MHNNSKFRSSYEGRACIDIIRTIYSTAKEFQIDVHEYVIDIMLHKDEAKAHPEDWTPWAWKQRK